MSGYSRKVRTFAVVFSIKGTDQRLMPDLSGCGRSGCVDNGHYFSGRNTMNAKVARPIQEARFLIGAIALLSAGLVGAARLSQKCQP
jgi:hypothetical protein